MPFSKRDRQAIGSIYYDAKSSPGQRAYPQPGSLPQPIVVCGENRIPVEFLQRFFRGTFKRAEARFFEPLVKLIWAISVYISVSAFFHKPRHYQKGRADAERRQPGLGQTKFAWREHEANIAFPEMTYYVRYRT